MSSQSTWMKRAGPRWRSAMAAAVSGPPLSALDTLLAAVGGTSKVKAMYHAGTNVAVTGGLVQTWDDVRGTSGFGPQIVAFGGTKPAYDAGNKIVTTSGTNWLQTTENAAFDLRTDGTVVMVVALPAGASFPVVLSDDPYTGPTGIGNLVGDPGHSFNGGSGSAPGVPPVGNGTTQRLYLWSRAFNGLAAPALPYSYNEVWGRARDCSTNTSDLFPVGNRCFCIGGLPNSGALALGAAVKIQFAMFIDHQISDAEHTAILTYMAADTAINPTYDNSAPAIFCEGNSRTYGTGSTTPGGATAYPQRMKAMNAALSTYDVRNVGVPSQKGQSIAASFDSKVKSAYNASRSKNFYVYWEMNNDEAIGGGLAPAQTATQATCQAAKDKGFTVFVCTEIMSGGAGWTGAMEVDRLTYNAWLRANAVSGGWAHAVVDLAAITQLSSPDPAGGTNTYYNADKIHLLDAGNDLVATAVYNALVPYL